MGYRWWVSFLFTFRRCHTWPRHLNDEHSSHKKIKLNSLMDSIPSDVLILQSWVSILVVSDAFWRALLTCTFFIFQVFRSMAGSLVWFDIQSYDLTSTYSILTMLNVLRLVNRTCDNRGIYLHDCQQAWIIPVKTYPIHRCRKTRHQWRCGGSLTGSAHIKWSRSMWFPTGRILTSGYGRATTSSPCKWKLADTATILVLYHPSQHHNSAYIGRNEAKRLSVELRIRSKGFVQFLWQIYNGTRLGWGSV